jgi:hypothetical protein
MSAVRSLSGVDRTWRRKPNSVAMDPDRTLGERKAYSAASFPTEARPVAVLRTVRRQQAYLTKLKYEASASISSGPRWLATIGIGDAVPE